MSDAIPPPTEADYRTLDLAAEYSCYLPGGAGEIDGPDDPYAALIRRCHAAEARVAELEAGLRPFAEWYRTMGHSEIAASVVEDYRHAAELIGATSATIPRAQENQ